MESGASDIDFQEHSEAQTPPDHDTHLEDANIASTSRKRRRSVSQSPLVGAVIASSDSSKHPSPNMSDLSDPNINLHTTDSCSPPAIIIDLDSPPRLPETILERFSFKDASMTPELAAKTLADHAKAMKLDTSDIIDLASWLRHLEQLPENTINQEELDHVTLHQSFWGNIAIALKQFITLYPLGDIFTEKPDVFIDIFTGTAALTRTLLRVEASCAESHRDRRDSIDENKPQPYHLQYNDITAALVILFSNTLDTKNISLRHIRQGVVEAFVNDSTTMSTLITFVHSMVTMPDSIHDVLVNLRLLLDLLAHLFAYLEQSTVPETTQVVSFHEGLAQVLQSADQNILSLFDHQVNSVEALGARLPIITRLVSFADMLFTNFERDDIQEWGLQYTNLLSPFNDGSNSETTLSLQGRVVSSPHLISLAWNFLLGIRLLLHSDLESVTRFGSKVLALAVETTEKRYDVPSKSADVHLLFAYLASCQTCSLVFKPSTTGAVIRNCQSLLTLFIQTSNFGRRDFAIIWELMNSSPDTKVQEACLALFVRFSAKEFQNHQIKMMVELFAGTEADILWPPALGLMKLCTKFLHESGDSELWESTTTLLLPALRSLAMPTQSVDMSWNRLKFGTVPLEMLEAIVHYGISDEAMGGLIDDCLQRLDDSKTSPAESGQVLRTLLLVAPDQIKRTGRLQRMDVIAFDAFGKFLDNVGKLDNTDQEAHDIGISHTALFHLLMVSIFSLDHPTSIDHCQLWDYITGAKALKLNWRASKLKSIVQYAANSPNIAMLVRKGASDCLLNMDKSHASPGLLSLTTFILSSASLDEFVDLTAFCKTMMALIVSIDDKQLATELGHVLAAEVFSIASKHDCDPYADDYPPLVLVDVCLNAVPLQSLSNIKMLHVLRILSAKFSREYRIQRSLVVEEVKLSEETDLCRVCIDIHQPSGSTRLENWLVDPSTTLQDLETILQGRLKAGIVRAYCRGQEIVFSSKPTMILSDFATGSKDLTILVRAVGPEGLPQGDQHIFELLPSVERAIVNQLGDFTTVLSSEDAIGESISQLLLDIWHCSEITRERLTEPIHGPDLQHSPATWKTMFEMRKLLIALEQPWKPSDSYSVAKVETIQGLTRLICEVNLDDIILLHTALAVLSAHLKGRCYHVKDSRRMLNLIDIVDEEKRSAPFPSLEVPVSGIIRQLRSVVNHIQESVTDGNGLRSARMIYSSLSLLNTTILEIAACSEEAYAYITTSAYDCEVLPWLLGSENADVVCLTASALQKILASFPDAGTEAKINPGEDSIYAPAYLDRALKIKTWVCRHALIAVSQRLERLHTVSPLLHLASTGLFQSAIRTALVHLDFQAHFDMLMSALVEIPLVGTAAEKGSEALIASICSLLSGYVQALTSSGTRLQLRHVQPHFSDLSSTDSFLSDYGVDKLHGFLFPPTSGSTDSTNTQPLADIDARGCVYHLLRSINTNGDHAVRAFELLSATIDAQDLRDDFRFPGRGPFIKSADCPTGLENMSQTCYLNSLVQQLFHNNRFRTLIGEVPLPQDKPRGVLAALKATFAYLQHSCSTYFTPVVLCEALGVDVTIQEDAGLFFQDLMSRLEEEMPDDQWKKRLMSTFMITDKSQTMGECRHVSETSSVNLVLPLPVKNKRNLFESLDAYVAGSELGESEPFRCEKCQQEGKQYLVQASRRTCLCNIPDDLVVHLMKFEFDSADGSRKINDPFEFPSKLDMAPYTMGALADNAGTPEPDEFELVGVVVHHGLLAFGHYWSYVRRDSQDKTGPRWFRIEDADCQEVSLNHVLAECQGTPIKAREQSKTRLDSAFILFYRRKVTSEAVLESSPSPEYQDIRSMVEANNDNVRNIARLFDNDLQSYICDILCNENEILENSSSVTDTGAGKLALALKYMTKIMSHDGHTPNMQRLCYLISVAIQGNSMRTLQVLHFLLDEENATKLFLRSFPSVRVIVGRLLLSSLESFKAADPITYGITNACDADEIAAEKERLLPQVVAKLEQLAEQSSHHAYAWYSLFNLFMQVFDLGSIEAYYVSSSKLVDIGIEFLSTPADDDLCKKRPELAKVASEALGTLSWKSVAKFLGKVFDYPMKFPDIEEATPTNGTINAHEVPEIWFTLAQIVLLGQSYRGMLHFVYNVCLLCGDDPDTPSEEWASSQLLVPLVDNNTPSDFSRRILGGLYHQVEIADKVVMFFNFMGPLRALCMQTNMSAGDRADLITLAIEKAHQDSTIALSSIGYVRDFLPDSACWPRLDTFMHWVVTLLCKMRPTTRSRMLLFLKKHVFKTPRDREIRLPDQIRSSRAIIELLDELSPEISDLIAMDTKRCNHAIAAFLLGMDALEHRYRRFLGFRNQLQLEVQLENGIRSRREVSREAQIVYRIKALQMIATRFKDWAAGVGLDLEPLMAGVDPDVEMTELEETDDELSSCSSGSWEETP